MAINSFDISCDKSIPKSLATPNNPKTGTGDITSCRLVKIDFATEGSICSSASKCGRKKTPNYTSPYLNSDSVQLLSHVTEKTFVHKKGKEYISSFPLAVDIYKANSHEFKTLKKANRKAKKSVLTLPNDQAPMPITCTVSDMNDSEYFNQDEDRKKTKKRNPVSRNRKPKGRDYEFYDRDARYCSQMNINLDCSSTDMIQSYGNPRSRKSTVGSKQQSEEKPNPHDVWAVLRNINRFQFRPSPPMSEDSFITLKKKKGVKRRNNRKDMRVVETCRTEEFAYISSYEVDSRSPQSFSKSSSFDRITVIDKQDDFSKICKEFEKRLIKSKNLVKCPYNKSQNKNHNNKAISNQKANVKSTIAQKTKNPKMLALEPYSKKQCNNSCGDTTQNKIVDKKEDSDDIINVMDKSFKSETVNNQFSNLIGDEEIVGQEFIYSGNSGSSKAAINSEIINKRVPGSTKSRLSSHEFNNPFNGITKVILSKGPANSVPNKPEPPRRKRQPSIIPSRVSTNHPVSPKPITIIPKLTQTEIKRRLAKMKFPIVVLGKDQLSSTFEVQNTEPVQFNGLDEKVWPFMNQWQINESINNTLKTKTESSQKKKCSPEIIEFNKQQRINRGFMPSKQLNAAIKATNDSRSKGKVEQKRITPPSELQQQTQPKKPKPIRQFKEKMLKMLYKHSSIQDFIGENDEAGGNDGKPKRVCKITSKADASTEMNTRTIPKDVPRSSINSPVMNAKQTPTTKQPWSKARWASDFIENVIRKIKNGVYYNHESKLLNRNQGHECKEVEIQTIAPYAEANPVMQSISKITIKKKQDPITIPGFDDNTLPALEIKSMTKNEISVKHCVTNIMVHFDITVPNEPVINLKKSSSLIPLQGTESQTKIFKCKTSIINAMLPAELCSILPKMMWNIIESREALALPPVPVEKSVSHLSTISEIHSEISEPFKIPFIPHLRMTLQLQKLVNGRYPSKMVLKHEHKKVQAKGNELLTKELLPRLTRSHFFECVVEPTSPFKKYNANLTNETSLVKDFICKKQLNTCMTLQTYSTSDRQLIPAIKRFDLMSFLQRMSSYLSKNIISSNRVCNYFFDKNITIDLTTTNSQGFKNQLSINIRSLVMNINRDNIPQASDNRFGIANKDLPAIQCDKTKIPLQKGLNQSNQASTLNKPKKKGFVKLYRKCKSSSNLTEKHLTSLSKIVNLDDFLQALGSAKVFSGVFDNMYAQKILSSVKEMKSWISDINPTQALLILLLMNKKDTPNLVRFRPVLLQGIAVNRITRANELDMEIEVIEKEHLNKLSRYEGISYLPASTENQDNLLEELCWIAKTTASDYQRTFDETSEMLLKSLLEKRKKLNPSYLRVMARYVGLGLLKSPIKK